MGTDKGILFDLIASQKLARPIQEFKPLTDEELAQAGKISPVIKEVLTTMNNKLKQTIEENKKKSGYTVDRVNIADIPAKSYSTPSRLLIAEKWYSSISGQHGAALAVWLWSNRSR